MENKPATCKIIEGWNFTIKEILSIADREGTKEKFIEWSLPRYWANEGLNENAQLKRINALWEFTQEGKTKKK